MPLALLGILGLTAVVLVHELAEVLVIANGVRAGHTHAPATDSITRIPITAETPNQVSV